MAPAVEMDAEWDELLMSEQMTQMISQAESATQPPTRSSNCALSEQQLRAIEENRQKAIRTRAEKAKTAEQLLGSPSRPHGSAVCISDDARFLPMLPRV